MEFLPEYYKNIKFTTSDNRTFDGYFEPQFFIDDAPMFVHENNRGRGKESDCQFFAVEDVISWEYF